MLRLCLTSTYYSSDDCSCPKRITPEGLGFVLMFSGKMNFCSVVLFYTVKALFLNLTPTPKRLNCISYEILRLLEIYFTQVCSLAEFHCGQYCRKWESFVICDTCIQFSFQSDSFVHIISWTFLRLVLACTVQILEFSNVAAVTRHFKPLRNITGIRMIRTCV